MTPGESLPKDAQAQTNDFHLQRTYNNVVSINSSLEANYQHDNRQEDIAQLISGIDSLGISTSSDLQQALEDQHGSLITREYSDAGVVGGMEYSTGSNCLDLGPFPREDQWSWTYADTSECLNGELAGIGAQFGA